MLVDFIKSMNEKCLHLSCKLIDKLIKFGSRIFDIGELFSKEFIAFLDLFILLNSRNVYATKRFNLISLLNRSSIISPIASITSPFSSVTVMP